MKVINLYGGPGTGKSTTAAQVFALLKLGGFRTELVTEYAKDLVYDEAWKILSDQLLVFASQYHRVSKLQDKVDFVVTDSPLLLSLLYGDDQSSEFHDLIISKYKTFDNFDVFLTRNKPYYSYGRTQTEDEARLLDDKILQMLHTQDIKYWRLDGGDGFTPERIFLEVKKWS